MRSHDRETVIRLRNDLQACQSRQRVALTSAMELRQRVNRLAMLIPIKEMADTTVVLQLAARLMQMLSQDGGGQ